MLPHFVKHFLLTEENIRYHFLDNPEWERVYKKHYPNNDTTLQNYVERAYQIFIDNNCKFIEAGEDSKRFKHIKTILEIEFYKDDEFIFSQFNNASNAFEQVLCSIISDYEVDFSKFK